MSKIKSACYLLSKRRSEYSKKYFIKCRKQWDAGCFPGVKIIWSKKPCTMCGEYYPTNSTLFSAKKYTEFCNYSCYKKYRRILKKQKEKEYEADKKRRAEFKKIKPTLKEDDKTINRSNTCYRKKDGVCIKYDECFPSFDNCTGYKIKKEHSLIYSQLASIF